MREVTPVEVPSSQVTDRSDVSDGETPVRMAKPPREVRQKKGAKATKSKSRKRVKPVDSESETRDPQDEEDDWSEAGMGSRHGKFVLACCRNSVNVNVICVDV